MVDLGLVVLIVTTTFVKKRVEDVMPIAIGNEQEELEAELEVIFVRCYPNNCLLNELIT